MRTRIIVALLLLPLLAGPRPALALAPAPELTDLGATVNFPDGIDFSAQVQGGAGSQVVLEYGVKAATCGDIVAKAFPQESQDQPGVYNWTWQMQKSGSLPTGSLVWYRWRVTDAAGQSSVTSDATVLWIDSGHKWNSISKNGLVLHWYSGTQSFAAALSNAAADGLQRAAQLVDTAPPEQIDVYLYGSAKQMRDSTLFAPGWTGGEAFPENDIVMIGIEADNLDWDKRILAHELTHVLVGHLVFSCLSSLPIWLNEGLAVYNEGTVDPAAAESLREAIDVDTLISLHSLSSPFSAHPDKADLSYSESNSVVTYLMQQFGPERMRQLLAGLRDGQTVDGAVQATFGFGLDRLETRWRASIGAQPYQAGASPAALLSHTAAPTYQPASALPVAAVTPTAAESDQTWLYAALAGVCAVSVIAAVLLVLRRRRTT